MWTALATTVSKTVGDVTKSVFNFLSKRKDKQSETEIIKEKRELKKATDIAEEMWGIAFRNIDLFSEKDKKRFLKLYDDFIECN